jgi:hypothetical protein
MPVQMLRRRVRKGEQGKGVDSSTSHGLSLKSELKRVEIQRGLLRLALLSWNRHLTLNWRGMGRIRQ